MVVNSGHRGDHAPGRDEGLEVKDRLLEAALSLFAEHGFVATSLRDIASTAKTNLSAIRHYYGSKEDLIKAVFDQFAVPVNTARLHKLGAYEAELDGAAPDIERIVRALVEPTVSVKALTSKQALRLFQLISIAYMTGPPNVMQIIREEFDPMANRFIDALARALPHVPRKELSWRYVFMMGAVVHAITDATARQRVKYLGGEDEKDNHLSNMIDHLVPFLVNGLRSSPPGEGRP